MAGNALWAWGNNPRGQIGDSTTVSKSSPVQVDSTGQWSSLASGNCHSIAVRSDSTLWAWGANVKGQLGDGTTVDKSSPVQIGTLGAWSIVSTTSQGSQGGSLAIKTDSTLWAWGYNGVGQLALGNTADVSSPVQVGTLATWSKVSGHASAGHAIKTDGTLWGWGYKGTPWNIIGTGSSNQSSPVQVGVATTWSSIGGSGNSATALQTDSSMWQWGAGSENVVGNTTTPNQVGTLAVWKNISSQPDAAGGFSVKTDSTLWSWGNNVGGQVGDGTTTNRTSPVQIGTLATWSSATLGALNSVALDTSSNLWAWGKNAKGEIGDSTTTSKSSPVQVGTLSTWKFIAAGSYTTYAMSTAAAVVASSKRLFMLMGLGQ